MADYFLPLVERREIAERTWAFWFDIAKTKFHFKAGQNADFGTGDVRTFSIASSPNDHERIMIATRRVDLPAGRQEGSDFKKNLLAMPIGTKLRVQGPFGDFILPRKSDLPIVMLAGGIGITPFLSMITWATEEQLPHKITLFFANSSPERATFVHELETLQRLNPHFKLTLQYSKATFIPDLSSRYYISGPPGFCDGMRTILDEAGINDGHLKTEEFSGY